MGEEMRRGISGMSRKEWRKGREEVSRKETKPVKDRKENGRPASDKKSNRSQEEEGWEEEDE